MTAQTETNRAVFNQFFADHNLSVRISRTDLHLFDNNLTLLYQERKVALSNVTARRWGKKTLQVVAEFWVGRTLTRMKVWQIEIKSETIIITLEVWNTAPNDVKPHIKVLNKITTNKEDFSLEDVGIGW